MVIGVTGSSGSGKTTLSKLLKEELGLKIIDADKVVKKMSMSGEVYFKEIVNKFGKDILLDNGEIDKTKLANIIFNDSKKRNMLNLLTYKYVVSEIKNQVKKLGTDVIIDAPLLIESKLNEICDIVISTIADKNVKIDRICKRDNIDNNVATTRLNAQPDNDFYIENSNYVIINNDYNNLNNQIKSVKQIINSKVICSKEIVILQHNDLRIMQFKEMLKYKKISHAFSLKPFDFESNDTYEKNKVKANVNYEKVCEILKLDSKNIVRPYQTHTNNIKNITTENGIFPKELINIDGLITREKNKILSLVFADCTPIYIYDKEKNIIGNIHSGWQGTLKKIAKKAIQQMNKEFNCNPEKIVCVIGPTIRKCHFEVQKDVRDMFYDKFKYMKEINSIIEYNSITESYFIDTVQINKNLLLEEGILEDNIIDSDICSVCNNDVMHSYRKEGKNSGRNTSLICLKNKA